LFLKIANVERAMVRNANELNSEDKRLIAREVSILSKKENSSLLEKTEEQVLSVIESGIVFAKMEDGKPVFVVAVEPTGNEGFIEIGMTCNLDQKRFRGSRIFPQIVDFYKRINGNGKTLLYLTTTDARMVKVAMRCGFTEVKDLRQFFPSDVLDFCCSPCKPEKTGVKHFGQQIQMCPRFEGAFIPSSGEDCVRLRCRVLARKN